MKVLGYPGGIVERFKPNLPFRTGHEIAILQWSFSFPGDPPVRFQRGDLCLGVYPVPPITALSNGMIALKGQDIVRAPLSFVRNIVPTDTCPSVSLVIVNRV